MISKEKRKIIINKVLNSGLKGLKTLEYAEILTKEVQK